MIVIIIRNEGQSVSVSVNVFIGHASIEQCLIERDHRVVVFVGENMDMMHLAGLGHFGDGAWRVDAMRCHWFRLKCVVCLPCHRSRTFRYLGTNILQNATFPIVSLSIIDLFTFPLLYAPKFNVSNIER